MKQPSQCHSSKPADDSSPQKRMLAIVKTVAIGLSLAILSMVALGQFCSSWTCSPSLCTKIAENPPWTLLTSLVAAPSVLLTWWWRTVQKDKDIALAKREERSKRFADSVRMLGDDKLALRIGAVYSLQSLATDAEEELPRVTSVLCAFLRQHDGPRNEPNRSYPSQPADIQCAFTVVGGLPKCDDVRKDLRGARLERLEGAKLSFENALLSRCQLRYGTFTNAIFREADMTGADLAGASLTGADFHRAILDEVVFDKHLWKGTCLSDEQRKNMLTVANALEERCDVRR